MEVIFMFAAAIVVVFVAVIGIIGGLSQRFTKPTAELKERVTLLETRLQELEEKTNDNNQL